MARALSPSEPGTHGARRIAWKQVAKALEALDGKTVSDEDVHTARKDLKKARATLRLLRDALGNPTYNKENRALRDVARPLSEIRDSKVLGDTINKLVEHFGAPARALPLNPLRQALTRNRKKINQKVLHGPRALKSQRDDLRSIRERARRWSVGKRGWSVLGSGLKRVYAGARKALARAEADPSPENLHEWRKQTKYLWHQLQLLEPLWPGVIGALADQVHQLADYLGDDHDLSVLRTKVLEKQDLLANPAARDAMLALIDRYRADLRDKAFVLGHRLYEEKPGVFESRFGKYWRDWRHGR
jgi:CHAD domain-containing protein